MDYPDEANEAVFAQAEKVGAPLYPAGSSWHFAEGIGRRTGYRDAKGSLFLPEPPLEGWHQRANSALAAAMLRHQNVLPVSVAALKAGVLAARWPARLQVLGPGPVTELAGCRVLLDGGHNPDAAMALADYFTENNTGPIDALIGMMALKDARNFLTILAPHLASVTAVPIEGNDHLPLDALEGLAKEAGVPQTSSAPDLVTALEALPRRRQRHGADRRFALPRRQGPRREPRSARLNHSAATATGSGATTPELAPARVTRNHSSAQSTTATIPISEVNTNTK